MFKQIAVVSGKGGTGKTTVTAALTHLFKNNIPVDCDVDASNLFLLFNPKTEKQYDYYGGKKAYIDINKCSSCGLCAEICRFDAVNINSGEYSVDSYSCEGCGYCVIRCPEKAIELSESRSGEYYISSYKEGRFIHGELEPGEETSGGLIAAIRKKAIESADKTDYIIIDGSPGIGCPATSSITGVSYVLIVSEPTLSGFHDLIRIMETTEQFRRKYSVVINKYDINTEITEKIEKYCSDKNIKITGKIPFDKTVMKAVQESNSIINYNSPASEAIKKLYKNITEEIK